MYGDASTLGTRINEHCHLLAKRKRAVVGDNVHSTQLPQDGGRGRAIANSSTQPLAVGKAPPRKDAGLSSDLGYGQISGDSRDSQSLGPVRSGPQTFAPAEDEDESEPEVIKVSCGAVPAGLGLGKRVRAQQRGRLPLSPVMKEMKEAEQKEENGEEVLVLSSPSSEPEPSAPLGGGGGGVEGLVTSPAGLVMSSVDLVASSADVVMSPAGLVTLPEGLVTSPAAVSYHGQQQAVEETAGDTSVSWVAPDVGSDENMNIHGHETGGAVAEAREERDLRVSRASSVSSGAASTVTINSTVSSSEGGTASHAPETHADHGQGHKEVCTVL